MAQPTSVIILTWFCRAYGRYSGPVSPSTPLLRMSLSFVRLSAVRLLQPAFSLVGVVPLVEFDF
jgi:hypothetical protein